MKKVWIFCLLMAVVTAFTSCIKDKSTGADECIAKIEFKGKLDSVYLVNKGDNLVIDAPQLAPSSETPHVEYQWDINGKVVSNQKELVYSCDDFGKLQGRLRVSNGDDISYMKFLINVQYAVTEGLIILSDYQDKCLLSYYPVNATGKKFIFDLMKMDMGKKPLALFVRNDKSKPLIYVSSASPAMLYKIEANLMMLLNKIETPNDGLITYMSNDGNVEYSSDLYALINHRLAKISFSSTTFSNSDQSLFERRFGKDTRFANFINYTYGPDGYLNGSLYFDTTHSAVIRKTSADNGISVLFKDDTANADFVGLCPIGNTGMDFTGILQDKISKRFKTIYFNAGFVGYDPSKNISYELLYMGEMPASLTKVDVVKSVPKKNWMLYASDNKIFVYNVLSKGNFPTMPAFVCGNGGVIADMYVSNDESKLYVALNDGNTDKVGSIYCYDLNTQKQLFKEEHIVGKIVQLGYKRDM